MTIVYLWSTHLKKCKRCSNAWLVLHPPTKSNFRIALILYINAFHLPVFSTRWLSRHLCHERLIVNVCMNACCNEALTL